MPRLRHWAVLILFTAPLFAKAHQVLDIAGNHAVWDPVRKVAWVAVPARAPSLPNTVTAIDPTANAISTSFSFSEEPNLLAISDDSSFLYVVFVRSGYARRIDLSRGVVDLEIRIKPLMTGDFAIRTVPGHPRSFALCTPETALPSVPI